MNIIIFGPPGSGKGTYASRLHSKLGLPVIATGDSFREIAKADTTLGRKVRKYIGKGELVPDNIVIAFLKQKLTDNSFAEGFILDGYPRTVEQAKSLESFSRIDATINLVVPEWIIIQRLSSRRICGNCREVYNIRFLKPRKQGICDKCSGELYQRIDDTSKVIRERLRVYKKQTQPLLAYYKGKVPSVEYKCESVDVPPETAVAEILRELNRLIQA